MDSFIVHISVLQSSGETLNFITIFIFDSARLDPILSQMNPVHTVTTRSINSTQNG
jgi:hypothetical protein